MDINITIKRGGEVDLIHYDPEFMAKLEAAMIEKRSLGDLTHGSRGYAQILRGRKELQSGIEACLPKETEQPYTITIKVEGVADRSPGPRYY